MTCNAAPDTVRGLPEITAEDRIVRYGPSERLAIVSDTRIARFRLEEEETGWQAVAEDTLHAPAQITAVAGEGATLWAAAGGRLYRSEDGCLLPVCDVCNAIEGLTLLIRHIVVQTAISIVVVHRETGQILAERSRPRGKVRIKPDREGAAILLIHRSRREVHRIDVERICRDPGRRPHSRPPVRPDPEDCDCETVHRCRRTPCCCKRSPETRAPGRRPIPPRRQPDDDCRPGSDGEGDRCIITYAFGAKLIRVNICDPEADPCTSTLRWPIGELRRARGRLVAISRDRVRLALIDDATLELVEERLLGSHVPEVLTLADSPLALATTPDGAGLTVLNVAPAPAADGLSLAAAGSTLQVFSEPFPLNDWSNEGEQFGTRNVLVIPILIPGQGFSGDIADWKAWVFSSGLLEKVQAYYDECSYTRFGVNFLIFGADTDDVYQGNPINAMTDVEQFYNDPWNPARLEASEPLGSGLQITFSGDETMQVRARPAVRSPATFELRFPAASARWRLPEDTVTLDFDPSPAIGNPRAVNLEGVNRDSVSFSRPATFSASATSVVVSRDRLENGDAQTELQDILNDMVAAATPAGDDAFLTARVVWHPDTNDNLGLLHVFFIFTNHDGNDPPFLTDFTAGSGMFDLFPEFDVPENNEPVEILSRFNSTVAGYADNMTWLLRRVIADGILANGDFDNVRDPYFRLAPDEVPCAVFERDGALVTRLSLGIDDGHARDDEDDPTEVSLISQSGLAKIGMNNAASLDGPDFVWDKRNALADNDGLLDALWTAVVSAVVNFHGDQTAAVTEINRFFFGVGLDADEQAEAGVPHSFIFAYVDAAPSDVPGDPAWLTFPPSYLERLRGAARTTTATDTLGRAPDVTNTRQKVVMTFKTNTMADAGRTEDAADTVAHELGHSLLGLSDLYTGAAYRRGVAYMETRDLMGTAASWPHFCLYHKQIKGWIDDDDGLLIERPAEGQMVDRAIVLVELERWNPDWDAATLNAIRAAVPGTGDQPTPVMAGAFLRLGGDGRLFNTLELRRKTSVFSQEMDPPRLVIANAYGYDDDTRYNDPDVDLSDEEIRRTLEVIKRYRRKIHLIADVAPGETFDLASAPEFTEAGLEVTLENAVLVPIDGQQRLAGLVRARWTGRGAIDVGFEQATPNWRSPDIGVEAPPLMLDPATGFPPGQPEDQGDVIVKPSGQGENVHRVFVRVHNFGSVDAENVQVRLLRYEPGGAGDHPDDAAETLEETVDAIAAGSFETVAFDWPVEEDSEEHVCFRAEIGDRDVAPIPGTNEPAGTDDSTQINDHAQQNVFEFTSEQTNPVDPIFLRYGVRNEGPLPEDVALYPRGLPPGVTVTIEPQRFRLGPGKNLTARVRIDQESARGRLKCGKDFVCQIEAWRVDAESEERWGACDYKILLRRKTQVSIGGWWFAGNLHVDGAVDPDVGLGTVRLHITGTTGIDVWRDLALGPGATYALDEEIVGSSGDTLFIAAYYGGNSEFAKSQSELLELDFTSVG